MAADDDYFFRLLASANLTDNVAGLDIHGSKCALIF